MAGPAGSAPAGVQGMHAQMDAGCCSRDGWTPVPFPPPLAHCKPENRSLAGPFSLCAKGVCRDLPPFGDWSATRDWSPNARRLFPPALRSRRDGFTISIYFNELTGSRCACVSLVPACLKADGEATRAAWSLVCLGSFARSFRGTVEIEKFRGQPAWRGARGIRADYWGKPSPGS